MRFAGDTHLITPVGPRPLSRLAEHDSVVVLSSQSMPGGFSQGGRSTWRNIKIAKVDSAPTTRIMVTRSAESHTFHCSPDTRLATVERTHIYDKAIQRSKPKPTYIAERADQLEAGAMVLHMKPIFHTGLRPSSPGVAHGLVCGDGTAPTEKGKLFPTPASIVLWGEKTQLLRYFAEPRVAAEHREHISGLKVSGLPRNWKNPPPMNESTAHLCGWWAGMIATDGHVAVDGSVQWSTAKRSDLVAMMGVCERIGVGYAEPRVSHNETRLGGDNYVIYFHRDTITEHMLVREDQRERFLAKKISNKARNWAVGSVSTGPVKELYELTTDTGTVSLAGHVMACE